MYSKIAVLRCLSVRPRVTVDQLPLQGRDEALGHRVVVGVGHRSHRGQKPRFFEAAAELNRGVLATPVGVVDQSGYGRRL